MTIQHRDIQNQYIHEPKGIVSAVSGQIYIADGNGSGTWRKPGGADLQGLYGDSGVAGKVVVSDGNNGFTFGNATVFGSMEFSNVNLGMSVPNSSSVYNNGNYRLITGMWSAQHLNGITFNTDSLSVSEAGVFRLDASLFINSPLATVAVKWVVNGTTYGNRPMVLTYGDSGSGTSAFYSPYGTLTDIVALSAGDFVQLYACCVGSTGIQLMDGYLSLSKA